MAQESVSAKEKAGAVKKPQSPESDKTFAEDSSAAKIATTPPADKTEAFGLANTSPGNKSGANDPDTVFLGGKDQVARPSGLGDQTVPLDGPADQSDVAKKAAKADSAEPKASLMGDYRLLKKLGQGGMGAVYKAHQISLDRDVAIKVLTKELAAKPSFVQRFQREARVMAKMDHPNILRCFEVGEALGYHYLSMEFIEGGSIEDWLKKLGKFSVGDALHIIVAVASGLQHAHEQHLVHRDVKPDNVLLTKKGVIKVADLGLAKDTGDDLSLTRTGTGAGTPIYMAPEQARDVKHVDGRVDIYALGVMLYVFVTGQAPFKGETLVELIEAKERGKFEPMRKFNHEAPERLELIVGKMMAKKPEHRYATCAEVIKDLVDLGLTHERLSFLGENAASLGPSVAAPIKGPITSTPISLAPGTMAPMTIAPITHTPEPKASDFWYWKYISDNGKRITRKLTREQVVTLIKSNRLETNSQISKTQRGGYRSLGAYGEFKSYTLGQAAKERADRKSDKVKEMYEQIEQEEEARQRKRWWQNLTLRVGGFFGLILWLAILAAVAVGLFFLIKYGIYYFGHQVERATAS